jgi:hypothetical protein
MERRAKRSVAWLPRSCVRLVISNSTGATSSPNADGRIGDKNWKAERKIPSLFASLPALLIVFRPERRERRSGLEVRRDLPGVA